MRIEEFIEIYVVQNGTIFPHKNSKKNHQTFLFFLTINNIGFTFAKNYLAIMHFLPFRCSLNFENNLGNIQIRFFSKVISVFKNNFGVMEIIP